jgi:hypothetical protein
MYIADILRNRPKLIVDVVAVGSFGFNIRERHGLEEDGRVWDAIRDYYVLLEELPSADESCVYKVYQRIDDARANDLGMVRIVDESGEDYLFPAVMFQPIQIPAQIERQLFSQAA